MSSTDAKSSRCGYPWCGITACSYIKGAWFCHIHAPAMREVLSPAPQPPVATPPTATPECWDWNVPHALATARYCPICAISPPATPEPTATLEDLLDALMEEYRLYINAVIDSENPTYKEDYTATAAARNALTEYVEREIQSAYDRGYEDA